MLHFSVKYNYRIRYVLLQCHCQPISASMQKHILDIFSPELTMDSHNHSFIDFYFCGSFISSQHTISPCSSAEIITFCKRNTPGFYKPGALDTLSTILLRRYVLRCSQDVLIYIQFLLVLILFSKRLL